jgi:hypothetical protein
VPSDLATAVNIDYGGAIQGAFTVFGALTGCVNGIMFEKDDRIGPCSRSNFLMHLPLEFPAGFVVHEIGR